MIKNKPQLIKNGETEAIRNARILALESLESALKAADPKTIVKNKLALNGSLLQIEQYCFDINKFKHVYVVGGGKASGSMAEALEEILGPNINEGIINVPHGSLQKAKKIKLHGASHPLPDQASVEGTKQILAIVEKAKVADLVVCLISGGGSSLTSTRRYNTKGKARINKRSSTIRSNNTRN